MKNFRRKFCKLIGLSYLSAILLPYNLLYSATKKIINKDLSDEEVFNLLIKCPKLIERPIVVSDNRAILGRPPEKVLDII